MSQDIEFLQVLDAQLGALDAQINTLNFEFLAALNSADGTTNGKTALETAIAVMEKARITVGDKAMLEQRRQLVAQLVTAEFAPREMSDRETTARQIAERARSIVIEAQNLESQIKSGRSRAEQSRTHAIDQLRRLGLSNDDINRINSQVQQAKQNR